MPKYNTLNVKLSNSHLNNLKFSVKNRTEVTLNLSSNLIRTSNDETNFPHKLLLTDTQVSKIRKSFANGSSDNMKFSKTELFKMIKSAGFIPIPFTFDSPTLSKTLSEPIVDSYMKELSKIFFDPVDARLSLLGKKM